jgi:hypothetical protein
MRCYFGANMVLPQEITSLTARCVIPSQSSTGTVSLTVSNDDITSSSAQTYTFKNLDTVSSVSPGTIPQEGRIVTVTGTNFVNADTLSCSWSDGSKVIATYSSATSLTCFAPASTGTGSVFVTSNGLDYATTSATVTYVATPTADTIFPLSGVTNGGMTATVTGSQFVSGGTCKFGSTETAVWTVDSPTQIRCIVPAAAAIGPVSVYVTNIPTREFAEVGLIFTYRATPSVVDLWPIAGAVAGGTTVVLTGPNLMYYDDVMSCTFDLTQLLPLFIHRRALNVWHLLLLLLELCLSPSSIMASNL